MNFNTPLKLYTDLKMKPDMNRSESRRAAHEASGRTAHKTNGRQGTSKPTLMPLDEAFRFIAAALTSGTETTDAICYAPLTGHAGICTLEDVFADLSEEYKRPVPAYRVSQVCIGIHPGTGVILPAPSGPSAFALTEHHTNGVPNHYGLPVALILTHTDFEPLFIASPQRPRRVMPRIYDDRLWFNFSMTQSTANTLNETIELPYR